MQTVWNILKQLAYLVIYYLAVAYTACFGAKPSKHANGIASNKIKRVAVIGAGPCGIAATKILQESVKNNLVLINFFRIILKL